MQMQLVSLYERYKLVQIFSLVTLLLYGWFHIGVSFDGTLKDVFMLAFFTSVGFQSDLKVLKQGGRQ